MGKVFLEGVYVKNTWHHSEGFWDLCARVHHRKKQRLIEMMQIKKCQFNLSKINVPLEEECT